MRPKNNFIFLLSFPTPLSILNLLLPSRLIAKMCRIYSILQAYRDLRCISVSFFHDLTLFMWSHSRGQLPRFFRVNKNCCFLNNEKSWLEKFVKKTGGDPSTPHFLPQFKKFQGGGGVSWNATDAPWRLNKRMLMNQRMCVPPWKILGIFR